MVDRVSGAPAIQEPRAGATGSPSADLRSLQVTIQNIRERLRLLEGVLNQLIAASNGTSTTSSTTTSGSRAAGPPGAVQYGDIGGALAGSMGLTYDPDAGTFAIGGRQAQQGIQWEDEGVDLGDLATADTVNFIGDGVTAVRVGNTINVYINASAGDAILTEDGDYLTTEADEHLVQE